MANELVVKYVIFHSVLKELIVTYSINSKKWPRIFYDGLSYISSNKIEDDFLTKSSIELNRKGGERIALFV
jgi:hypothetical protein